MASLCRSQICGVLGLLVFTYLVLLVPDCEGSDEVCVVKGRLFTKRDWYGYLIQKTFQRNTSRIQWQISYPVSECCVNLLIYYDDQMRSLNEQMTCLERERILPASNHQVIPLTTVNGTIGCRVWTETGQPLYVCEGERTFKSSDPRTWYVAISRCHMNASIELNLNYYFNITGYYGQCEADPLAHTYVPPKQKVETQDYLAVAVVMGVLAGIAIIVAVVLGVLFLHSRRNQHKKPKTSGGSVTSSQATMTQDIFYVNPSLSDRGEQSDSQYSRSSSENYYEVIPDRRSYESINTQLALAGHAHAHAHGHGGRAVNMATIPKEHRPRIPSYIFEDYPPPPYQPPQLMQGISHQQQSSSSTGHTSQGSTSSGHPLTQGPGAVPFTMPNTSGQQMQINARLLASSPQTSPIHSPGHYAPTTSLLQARTTANHVLNLAQPGVSTSTSGGGISYHSVQSPKPQANGQTIPLQNGGPVQNGGLLSGGRGYPLHNTNHAKLLNHNYRIQQFETTA